ncbi:MAG: TRAP transporter small permease subunit [Pseudomonadota bacterium]
MTAQTEEIVALSDPSEVDRAAHNRGDRAIVAIGNVVAWLFPILMLVIVAQVFLRNFGRMDIGPGNQAWLDDMQWWIYGIACLIGVAYAVTTNSHVRVDILYDGFPKERQRRIDLFALGWLFLPFAIITWDVTIHYAVSSVASREGSSSPNGLHNLWILKILMNLCFIVIGCACLARLHRLLKEQGNADGWAHFFWLLPSVVLAINIALFYALWWISRITMSDLAPRAVARDGLLMGEVEFGPYETQLTVLIALALSAALAGFLYARRAR